MSAQYHAKYRPFPPVELPNRQWPGRTITRAPTWCSVDLRDGNQALIEPMGIERKMRMFAALVEVGFREIEVGFPAASQPDFDFLRKLIDENLIPDGVAVQVLCQCREHLIERTYEALRGAKKAIVHLYNSTSTLQRKVVFQADEQSIIDIAVEGIRIAKRLRSRVPETEISLEYSPESFTGTELDYALDVCHAVMDTWEPTAEAPIILNLPATVEMSTPNVHADQIEYFISKLKNRERAIISVHPHNDRGTAVAAAELALLAGADRIEGTLFGNGERTGNVDVVTLALNMQTQGVDSTLRLDDLPGLIRVAEHCNRLPVHPRHPYAGELVFTAFSGSHQDAIRKGMVAQRDRSDGIWEVPYLPVDPKDLGRSYEAVIRINSQSGKSGVGYVLETEFGYRAPKRLLIDFSPVIQKQTEEREAELSPQEIVDAFRGVYENVEGAFSAPDSYLSQSSGPGRVEVQSVVGYRGGELAVVGRGNGAIDAFVDGLQRATGLELKIRDYAEHALGDGSGARAATYVELEVDGGERCFGVGTNTGTVLASFMAIISALNRLEARGALVGMKLNPIRDTAVESAPAPN